MSWETERSVRLRLALVPEVFRDDVGSTDPHRGPVPRIIASYRDQEIGVADASIVVLAERYRTLKGPHNWQPGANGSLAMRRRGSGHRLGVPGLQETSGWEPC